MKTSVKLNPMVFVRDENDPRFRAHIAQRVREAADNSNRLPLSELRKQLARRRKKLTNA